MFGVSTGFSPFDWRAPEAKYYVCLHSVAFSMMKQAGECLQVCCWRPIVSPCRGSGDLKHSGVFTHRPAVGMVEGGGSSASGEAI